MLQPRLAILDATFVSLFGIELPSILSRTVVTTDDSERNETVETAPRPTDGGTKDPSRERNMRNANRPTASARCNAAKKRRTRHGRQTELGKTQQRVRKRADLDGSR